MTAFVSTYTLPSRIISGLCHPLFLLGVCLLATVYQFQNTILLLIEKWSHSGTYAHGFIIFPVVLYLIWEKRTLLNQNMLAPTAVALIPIILCVNFWYIGQQNHILILQQFSLITLIISLALGFCGFKIFKILLFPLMYLYFSIPFGHFLISELQNITALFAVKGLEWTGITVYSEGWQITTTRGQFEVAAACSGIRYLIASIALGVLYAHYSYRQLWRKCVFMSLCIVIPVIANGIRAYGIVLLAHISHMKIAVGVDHLIYGWIFFGLMMLLLFWVGGLLREKDFASEQKQQSKELDRDATYQNFAVRFKTWFIALIFIGCSIIANTVFQNNALIFERIDIASNMTFDQWKKDESSQNNWQPDFNGAEQQLIRLRNLELKSVDFYIAQYSSEAEGKELISSGNTIYDRKKWNKSSQRKRKITFLDQTFDCLEYELFNRYSRRLVWAWYRVNGYSTQNIVLAKILVLYHRLKGDLQTPLFMAISSEYQYYPDNARAHMADLLDKSRMNT